MPAAPTRMSAALVILLAAGSLAGCAGSAPSASAAAGGAEPAAATVTVRDLRFAPATVAVHPGERVRWEFRDGALPHDVATDSFTSPVFSKGNWSRTFTRPGAYPYHCTVHPWMKGSVEVR